MRISDWSSDVCSSDRGVGWNFLFIGGTTLLTETYRPSEKAKVQALNDFLIFGVVVVASLSSGALLHHLDWRGVNLAAVPFLLAAGAMIATPAARRRARRAPACTRWPSRPKYSFARPDVWRCGNEWVRQCKY